ncbi:MAG: response regulator [Proteobacteria bacterium]|nr:response regulator [Pseudomonadota bacterium]
MSALQLLLALIVDSKSSVRNYLRHVLEKHAIVCVEADSAKTALEKLEEQQVDFIISEVHLQTMSGIQFVQIVHQNYREVP